MPAPPSLLGHRHDPVLGARNRAANEQQVPLGIDAHDPQTQLGVTSRANLPRHALPLDDARRVGTGADGAALPVPGVAVRARSAAGAVAVHDALKSFALGGAGDSYQLSWCENLYGHLGAGHRRVADQIEAPHHVGREVQPRLPGMAKLRPGCAALPPRPEAELDRLVADLNDPTGARLDDRHGNGGAVLGEDPGHPELSADESVRHRLTRP